MEKKTEKEKEKEIAESIYNTLTEYIKNNNISIRELAIQLKTPYTTVFTWFETLKKNKCISVKNILFLEEKLGITLIFFNHNIRL